MSLGLRSMDQLTWLTGPSLVFNFSQMMTLLKVTEDLETVEQEVFNRCEASFQAAIANQKDSGGSPFESLKKSISNLTTTSSQFSLINSSMLQSQILNPPTGNMSTESSGLLIRSPIKRAWDWRKAFVEKSDNATADEVLRILRLGLARDIAKGWLAIDLSS